jgi:RNA polymerase sigma factor (sigma-70 family)
MHTPSDYDLWTSFKKGDRNSLSVIYKRYYESLYAYGISMGMKKETVKDAIQEVFLKLYFNTTFNVSDNNLKFYLLKSVRNQLLDMVKLKKDTEDVSKHGSSFTLDVTIEDELINNEEYLQIKQLVNKALSQLTERQKEIIYLRYVEEIEYAEIARLMNIKVQSVRNIVFKAMEKLKGLDPDDFIFFFTLLFLRPI